MVFLGWANEQETKQMLCSHATQTGKHYFVVSEIFFVLDTNFVAATNVARASKQGNICVRNNVSATLCPRVPPPFGANKKICFYLRLSHSRLKSHRVERVDYTQRKQELTYRKRVLPSWKTKSLLNEY